MHAHNAILRITILLLALSLLAGCATPIGIRHVSPRDSYREATTSPLAPGVPSNEAKIVLHRFNLAKKYENDPAGVIEDLHDKALHDDRRDTLYALAELSYLHGEELLEGNREDQGLAPDYFLQAAIYAYLFLLDDRPEPPPTAFDIRARTACDLYNFALWRGMATGEGGALRLTAAERKLPGGALAISVDRSKFPWALEEFEKFDAADRYAVRGITIRNRTKGVGSALIGVKKATKESPLGIQAVPVTVFLRINGNLAEVDAGTATASLEFYSAYENNTLEIKGRRPPLETDTTTPITYVLETSKIWDFGLGSFLKTEFQSIPNGLYLTQPYQPGRIPVVFVHGTFSSPVWWLEMFNTLRADSKLRQKYQFWYFMYNSSAPIVVSAADLRDALRDKVAQLDPAGKDPALREMVVVGHSQGGLLTKYTAVDTGESLVNALTGKNLEDLDLSVENKAAVRRLLVVEPVPGVKRVVFISTPHRGSILSTGWVRKMVQKIVKLPANIIRLPVNAFDYATDETKRLFAGKMPTSIDGMSPDNPILKSLAAIPLVPGVTGHSIIAVKGDGDPKLGNDGVVAYSSAHLDGMASEFIVRSGHSCQDQPATIEEVRRILLEHLGAQAKPVL